jgi:glutathione synthase/RimK-type ligase-like ATP-grasp enzyme
VVEETAPGIGSEVRDPGMRAYCRHQASAFVWGILDSLEAPIFNNPRREERAGVKAVQLKCAAEVGLRIPDTLMTNNSADVKEFYERLDGRVIFKMPGSLPGPTPGTQRLEEYQLDRLDLLSNAPVLFQEEIPPNKDIRVMVVGERVFAAEACSRFVDWRYDGSIIWRHHRLSGKVDGAINKLMMLLGLDLASFDFRLSEAGEYCFFEVNPNGQFLFIEVDDNSLDISREVASFFAKHCGQDIKES